MSVIEPTENESFLYNYYNSITLKNILNGSTKMFINDLIKLFSSNDELKILTSVNDLNKLKYKINQHTKYECCSLTSEYIENVYDACFHAFASNYNTNFNNLLKRKITTYFNHYLNKFINTFII